MANLVHLNHLVQLKQKQLESKKKSFYKIKLIRLAKCHKFIKYLSSFIKYL